MILNDGSRLKAKIVGRDTKIDLALLQGEAGEAAHRGLSSAIQRQAAASATG